MGARILTSFAQAAAPSDWALTWGAAPIVEERCVPPNFAWSPLRLRSPPVLSTVMAHLQAVRLLISAETIRAKYPSFCRL